MSASGEEEEDRAGIEAAYWCLALEEEPGNAELRARFEAWLAANPANRAAWSNTIHVQDLIASPGYAAHRARRAGQPLPAVGTVPCVALAALAAAACIGGRDRHCLLRASCSGS
jgi:ferric-dicitrate binding protein FerR (iron transport regulator)